MASMDLSGALCADSTRPVGFNLNNLCAPQFILLILFCGLFGGRGFLPGGLRQLWKKLPRRASKDLGHAGGQRIIQ